MFGYLIVWSQGIDELGESSAIYTTRIFHNNIIERRNLSKWVVEVNLNAQEEVSLATLHSSTTVVISNELRKIQLNKEKDTRACPQFRAAVFESLRSPHIFPHANAMHGL